MGREGSVSAKYHKEMFYGPLSSHCYGVILTSIFKEVAISLHMLVQIT